MLQNKVRRLFPPHRQLKEADQAKQERQSLQFLQGDLGTVGHFSSDMPQIF